MKRVLRRVAPSVADRLRATLTPANVLTPSVGIDLFAASLREVQAEFDALTPSNPEAVARIASHSAVVVVGVAPFQNVSLLVNEMKREKIVLRELVIVDATAEEPRLVAIRDCVATWGRQLPLTRFIIVPFSRQELRFAEAIQQGWSATEQPYVWVVGRYNVPLGGCFEYLIKGLLDQREQAIMIAHTAGPDGKLRDGAVNAESLTEQARAEILLKNQFDLLNAPSDVFPQKLSACPIIETID